MKRQKLDVEIIKQRIYEKFNGKYEFVDFIEYHDAKQKEEIKCNECKNTFITSISALLFENHTCYCPNCKKEKRKRDFIEKVLSETNNEYIPLTEYNTCKEKVLFKHNISECMNEFWMTGDTFFNGGSRCPKCMHRQGADKLFISQEEFESRIENIHNGSIKILGKYRGGKERIKIQHIPCGRIFDTYSGDLLQGKGCRYCAGKMLKTQEQFEKDITDLYDKEYSVLGKYKNAKTKIKMRHNLCGYEWKVSPSAILKQRLCPNCGKSYGEKQIENFLIHNNINYKTQTTFEDCIDIGYLKFDFSIYDDNWNLLCLIEYDGAGHYQPVKFGGISLEEAQENYNSQIRRDAIKDNFCKYNNISLLRISYKDQKILYEILNDYLSNLFIRRMNNPSVVHLNTLKSPSVKFIDLVNELPNGVYPKSFFKRKLLNDNQNFSHHITQKPIVQSYIKENDIIIGRAYILVNKNETDDYDSYLNIGKENNFTFDLFQNMYELHKLDDGVYARFKLNLQNNATVKPTEYDFYNRYLKSRNIEICHSYIRINSDDVFKRPNWLLENRKKEAV